MLHTIYSPGAKKSDDVLSQVPGGYQDSLSSNTELGRAVQDACEELDNLSNLVWQAKAYTKQSNGYIDCSQAHDADRVPTRW